MPALRCEICHTDEGVYSDLRDGMHRGYLCSICVDAITRLGNTIDAMKRVIGYLEGEDINPYNGVPAAGQCDSCGHYLDRHYDSNGKCPWVNA